MNHPTLKIYFSGLSGVSILMKLSHLLFMITVSLPGTVSGQKKDTPDVYFSTLKRKLDVVLAAADFKPGERVADVGAGSGWFDAALAMHVDSIFFVIQDIDSAFLLAGRFNEALAVAAKRKGKPLTCTFRWAVGHEKSTGLPADTFDKVLLLDTYHHIAFRAEMIADLFSILKRGGSLIVLEPVARKDGDIYKTCQSVIFTPQAITTAFAASGFVHRRTLKTVRSNGQRVRAFVFTKA